MIVRIAVRCRQLTCFRGPIGFCTTKVSSYPRHFDKWGRESGVYESYVAMYKTGMGPLLKSLVKEKKLPSPDFDRLLLIPAAAEKLASWCEESPKLDARVRARFGDDWQQKYGEKRSKLASAFTHESKLRIAQPRQKLNFKQAQSPPLIGMFGMAPKLASASVRERAASEFAEWGATFYDRREANETKLAIGVEFDNTMFHGAFTSGRFRVPMQDGYVREVLGGLG